jgi:hypothetical protein
MPRYFIFILILISIILELSFSFYFKLLYFPINFILVFTLSQTLFFEKTTALGIALLTALLAALISSLPFGVITVALILTALLFLFLSHSVFNPESIPFLALSSFISSSIFSLLILGMLLIGNYFKFFSYPLDLKNFLIFSLALSSLANTIALLPISIFFKKPTTFHVRNQFPQQKIS